MKSICDSSSVSVSKVLLEHSCVHTHASVAVLSSRDRDCDPKASNVYYLAILRKFTEPGIEKTLVVHIKENSNRKVMLNSRRITKNQVLCRSKWYVHN